MALPAVIELGSDFEPRDRTVRRLPVGRLRVIAVLATVLVLFGALRAGAAPGQVPLVRTATLPGAVYVAYELGADALYTVSYPETSPFTVRPTLSAYRLSDGGLRWTQPLPITASVATLVPVGSGTLLVTSLLPDVPGDRTVALDAATGRRLWGSPVPWLASVPVADTVVLAAYLGPGGRAAASPLVDNPDARHPPAMVLQARSVRTGQLTWSRWVGPDIWVALPGTGIFGTGTGSDPVAVLVAPDGTATAVDLRAGRSLATRRIPVGLNRTVAGDEVGPDLTVTGHYLLVGYPSAGRPTLASYRLDDLSPQWTATVRSAAVSAVPCGALTCLTDENGTQAVDLATGRVGWSGIMWLPVGTLGGWVYALPPENRPGAAGLLATGTGATLLNLTGWGIIPGPAGGPYLMRTTAVIDEPVAAGTSVVGVLRRDRAGLRVFPLGPVTGVSGNACAASPRYLVCETDDHRLRVWRYQQ